jgi:hypothetical protein
LAVSFARCSLARQITCSMLTTSCSCDIVGVHPDQRATKFNVERYTAGLTMSVMEVTLNANSIGGPFLVAFGLKRHRQNMRNSSLAGAML